MKKRKDEPIASALYLSPSSTSLLVAGAQRRGAGGRAVKGEKEKGRKNTDSLFLLLHLSVSLLDRFTRNATEKRKRNGREGGKGKKGLAPERRSSIPFLFL